MFKRAFLLCTLIPLVTLVPACKKSVEGESKRWASLTQQAQGLTTLYPGFAEALTEQVTQATAAMENAKKESNPETQAQKMAEANSLLSGGFVSKLRDMDGKIKTLERKLTEMTTGAADKTDRMAAQQAAEGARKAVAEVKDMLKKGAKDAASAGTILGKLESDLSAAESNLDLVIKAANTKKEAAAKQEETKQEETKKATEAQEKVQADWKCSYCDKMNKVEAVKCANCGAAKE